MNSFVLVTSLSCDVGKTKTGQTRNSARKYFDSDGNWTCHEAPLLRVLNSEPLKVGQMMTAECVFPKCSLDTHNDWFLEENLLYDVLNFENIDNKTVSVVTLEVIEDFDSKPLSCRVWQSQSPAKYLEARQKLSIHYKPLNLPPKIISDLNAGDDVEVEVVFRSNPKPSSLIWIAGDKKIYYGTKGSKFISREISWLGRNYWNASLRIMNLTREDFDSSYSLLVKNAEGVAEYQIELEGLKIYGKLRCLGESNAI